MVIKLLLSIFFYLLVSVAVAKHQQSQPLSDAQQCRLQQLRSSQPSQVIQSEGGNIELWDENEDQFRCAGVAPTRNILQPNSLFLPVYHPFPNLIYIEQGRGLLGVIIPGCAQTFTSQGSQEEQQQQQQPPGQQGQEGSQEQQQQQQQKQQQQEGSQEDYHQKVYRIRQGDVIAVPAGVSHWVFNDGNQELVAVAVNDLNNQANQLDLSLRRSFYLAGGLSTQGQGGQRGQMSFQNVLSGFDENLLADAFNVPVEVIRKMQRAERGFIVNVKGGLSMIKPDEEEEQQGGQQPNGLEESLCTLRMKRNIDNRRDVEVYSRQAGRVNVANAQNLPILNFLDMSAEKGNLKPNALYTPHWSSNGHTVIYVTLGNAQVQIVDDNGQAVLDQTVNQGEMFVIPQFYASTMRAGRNGFEWMSVKTTSQPMKHPLVGYTSVLRAMPLQVITNAYQVSPREAQSLKQARGHQTLLLSPTRSS